MEINFKINLHNRFVNILHSVILVEIKIFLNSLI